MLSPLAEDNQPHFSVSELLTALDRVSDEYILAGVPVTRKPWGTERDVSVPELGFTLKHLVVHAGHRTSLQSHEHKDEVIIVIRQDDGFIEYGLLPGGELMTALSSIVHIHPGVVHRVTGPLEYIELSTYHPDDVIRYEDDYGRA